jgi:hypothetical protein
MKTISTGIYRHYKGQHYQVLGLARHSETEEYLVVYRCLYGDHSVWVRPYTMFTETIMISGVEVSRFQFVQSTDDSSWESIDDLL